MHFDFIRDFYLNHTETSFVYLLRSFKSRTSFSEPLRFFDVLTPVAVATDDDVDGDFFSSSSAFSFCLLPSTVSVSPLEFFSMSIDLNSVDLSAIPSLMTDLLLCQKSSLEQRQQRKRFSSINGDSFVIGDTISGS